MADFQLPDDSNVTFSASFTDDAGNPAAAPTGGVSTWGASDGGASLTLTPATDGMSCNVKAVGPLATGVQVNLSVVVPGLAAPLVGSLLVDVVPSAVTGMTLTPGPVAHN